jgi:hypothetical protein
MKIEGSGSASGSISQRHGSADPDPHQNVMDPYHWLKLLFLPSGWFRQRLSLLRKVGEIVETYDY